MGASFNVVKNSLMSLGFERAGLAPLKPLLRGKVAVASGDADVAVAQKLLSLSKKVRPRVPRCGMCWGWMAHPGSGAACAPRTRALPMRLSCPQVPDFAVLGAMLDRRLLLQYDEVTPPPPTPPSADARFPFCRPYPVSASRMGPRLPHPNWAFIHVVLSSHTQPRTSSTSCLASRAALVIGLLFWVRPRNGSCSGREAALFRVALRQFSFKGQAGGGSVCGCGARPCLCRTVAFLLLTPPFPPTPTPPSQVERLANLPAAEVVHRDMIAQMLPGTVLQVPSPAAYLVALLQQHSASSTRDDGG